MPYSVPRYRIVGFTFKPTDSSQTAPMNEVILMGTSRQTKCDECRRGLLWSQAIQENGASSPGVKRDFEATMRVCLLNLMLLLVACSFAQAEEATGDQKRVPVILPGMQAGGKILLPNQWSLRPAGARRYPENA